MTTKPIIQGAYNIVSNHGFADVLYSQALGQKSLFATKAFAANEVLAQFQGREVLTEPTYLTVQVGVDKHILLDPTFLQYINHSCEPNVFFDTTTMELIALTNIQSGEELKFFYPSTEWEMTQSFVCHCKTVSCLHEIKGAAHLPVSVLKKYRLTDFIRQQILSTVQ
jgi:hypothetical protein